MSFTCCSIAQTIAVANPSSRSHQNLDESQEIQTLASMATTVVDGLMRIASVQARHLLLLCMLSLRFSGEGAAEEPLIEFNLLQLPSSLTTLNSLQQPAKIFWEQTPLREGLQDLSQQYHLSLWLDRQVDPNQLVSLSSLTPGAAAESGAATGDSNSLVSRLEKIAAAAGSEVGVIENVVYIGPPGRLAAKQRAAVVLHDQLSRAPGNAATTLRDLEWPELTSSSQFMELVERNWQIQIEGDLPHDLFHAGALIHPSTLATQLSLLCGGFALEAQCMHSNQLRIQALQPQVVWQANYAKSDLHLRRIAELKSLFPHSRCLTRGSTSHVTGPSAYHLELLAPDSPTARPATIGNNNERFEFQVANAPVESVLNKLAMSIGFELAWDPACTPAQRSRLISFHVQQVALDQLLAAVATASQLRIVRQGASVSVKP